MSSKKTLFFNLEFLESLNNVDIIPILLMYMRGTLPRSKFCKLKFINMSKMVGDSFLLNPEPLLTDKSVDPIYILQYIRLAARRNYNMYKTYKIAYLDLSYYPELNIDKLKHNPLLTIANNKIHFKYEEIYNGNFV